MLIITAAWCIATETQFGSREVGNYVQGAVLLILRKQTGDDTAFLDQVYPEVEAEVKRQLDSMHELDDPHADAPDFTDTDYQFAAYAAALCVLTRYRFIEDIDVARELARGFGVRDYTALLGNDKANEVRLMTATEFGKKLLRAGEDAFSESLLRHALFAIREVAKSDQGAEPGRAWLKAEVKDYWSHRKTLIAILQYLSRFQHSLPTWQTDSKAAALLAGALENDH